MYVTVILIAIGALGKIPKGLVKGLEYQEIRGQVETIHTIALRLARETFGNLQSLKFNEKPSGNGGVKNSHEVT